MPPPFDAQIPEAIRVRGARQNNLKGVSLDIPLQSLIVVTGVSGSGKSSLVFDTVYAEGQRRYVETFSPYARQFLDRMDRPQVESIEGILPSIAIDQTNPVRTSRSTVGTMTELNDHLKVVFARAAKLYCRGCAQEVRRDDAPSIAAQLKLRGAGLAEARWILTFPVDVPENFTRAEILSLLASQGYTRIHADEGQRLWVVQDRMRAHGADASRVLEAVEAALRVGQGRIDVFVQDADGAPLHTWRFSSDLHCADCDLHYRDPTPGQFSFNSPVGACDACRGFGRVIGIDYGLVIPDESKTLRGGAIKPWQSESYRESQEDLMRFARKRGIPLDVPWRDLTSEQRAWVIDGEGEWSKTVWYGVRRFFVWLESKAYKMHIRVLLSRYRAYTECAACGGARLKPEALLWRIGSEQRAGSPPGFNIHDVMSLPIEKCRELFDALRLPPPLDQAAELVLGEVRTRLRFLSEVGLNYLTLDRQSRTLSGGEVQRINLTTALGTSLVNTLFVLDEPSIGLHARDVDRIVAVMHRLRDAGNTLLVVEHDAQVMRAADRLIDMGPGPGERGGEIIFDGTPGEIERSPTSLTGEYLSGRRRVIAARREKPLAAAAEWIEIKGAREHNLKNIDVRIPLGRLVCITGVSGSGKSTLVHDVLYAALRRSKGQPTEAPGAHDALLGTEHVDRVVMVDQTPIGRTTRSNPASYVGAFDVIRPLFAKLPLSVERKYTAGTFSFNSGKGRCPTCGGNGFEHIEMQFLSDVYLRCPDCNGKRFRAEILECRLTRAGAAKNIAEVLELTVREALEFFADDAEVGRRLRPLADVGLDYLRLGQPVPTLSGGEAQRLKLAGHLAEHAARTKSNAGLKGRSLLIFDEPTTGLHFDDVAKLLDAFARLTAAGDSLIVIEHHLDIISAADWIIDLGPEGGDAGGELVAAGTRGDIERVSRSHTGQALRALHAGEQALHRAGHVNQVEEPRPMHVARVPRKAIEIRGAREHNLKDVDVELQRDRFTVITGVSGSGKSTLAFDILFAEGQRRYLESLNAYARQFVQPASRPDVDAIFGIPPTVAIEQRTSRGGYKSTVATLTEIYHYLRLLFVKLGVQYCPACDVKIEPQSADVIGARIRTEYAGQKITLLAPLVTARKGLYTALARWAKSKGFARLRVDGEWLPTTKFPRIDRFKEHHIELPVASLKVSRAGDSAFDAALESALTHGQGVMHVLRESQLASTPSARAASLQTFSTKRACPGCGTGFPELDPRLFSFNSKHGWCPDCFGAGVAIEELDDSQSGEEETFVGAQAQTEAQCTSCHGARLNSTARHVLFQGESITAMTALPIESFARKIAALDLPPRARQISRDIVSELAARTAFLCDVGLGYLSLDRAAPTLSGGEAQRIRLAAQLGSNLRGVCYVLDEPTIGLHPRDNRILLEMLERLRSKGNTLIVVEHDEDTIKRADHVIDLGPGAGTHGGAVVAQGTARELETHAASTTGRYLSRPLQHPLSPRRAVTRSTPCLEIRGAKLHNLRSVDVRIPLQRLTAITGVSGSGKSSLAREVLLDNLTRLVRRGSRSKAELIGCREMRGWENLTRVLEVDQTPIGKTPRSCPATYLGIWDAIRRVFAETSEARLRGFAASRFSFNTPGGRCEACEGQGVRRIAMNFLPDVRIACDVCRGRRFNPETLSIVFKERSIGDVLEMSVEEAAQFFESHRGIRHPLALLNDLGLGYLTLGQQSPTLSGGESQRIKLVSELAKVRTDLVGRDAAAREGAHTLYVLDEPTVGLHMADVEKLIYLLHRLVEAGHSVVVIEHQLDVIAEADWLIDMGPEGGSGGGRVVAMGTPENVAKSKRGATPAILADFLRERAA